MTDEIMKSDILFESRTRSDGRQCWQRRRLVKSTATVNGEYDPELALAIQESLKQAELENRARANQEMNIVKKEVDICKENRGNSRAGSSHEFSNETKQLKELLLCHMDLIQQQQELIKEKDKTIKGLNSDKNALQCRLERMERRMSLLKQKDDPQESSAFIHPAPKRLGDTFYSSPAADKTPQKTLRKPLESSPAVKKLGADSGKKSSSIKTAVAPSPAATPEPNRLRQDQHRKRKLCSAPEESESAEKDLRTNKLYYVSYYEPVSDEIDTDCRNDIIKGAHSQLEVETPCWRIRPYTNLYVIEGTENHEDDTFVRRHQKPEIEEKRRKRWDVQRLREQKMYEKMKEKDKEFFTPGQKLDDPVDSFYPTLDSITHIEVEDRIPVTAFGHPIPYIKAVDFSLPWDPKTPGTSRTRHR